VTTWACLAILLAIAPLPLVAGRLDGAPAAGLAVSLVLLVLFGALLGTLWAAAPRGFALGDGWILVERRGRAPLRIRLADVRAVAPIARLRAPVRLAGSGGLFGYWGTFWSRELGRFRLYATRRDRLVRVDTARETFVLSPEPPDAFLAELRGRAPHAGAAPPVARRPFGRAWAAALAAVLLLVAGLAAVVGALAR
jgi:hypothetical protein